MRKPKLSRSDQARVNGAKSQGPKTPHGKLASSLNSLKTGRYSGKTVLLTLDNQAEYETQLSAYIRRFQPADDVELTIIRELCYLDWRLHKLAKSESAVLNHQLKVQESTLAELDSQVPGDLKAAVAIDQINRSSNILGLIVVQRQRLSVQRLSALRTLREIRKISQAPDFSLYLVESTSLTPEKTQENEPKPAATLPEAA